MESTLNPSHPSYKLLVCSLQIQFSSDLTCTVTPVEPLVFQLGNFHLVLRSSEANSSPPKQSTHWIMWSLATELMLFLKKLSPSAKAFSTLPRRPPCKPISFTTHGHTIAAHWACPLMIARIRVHNIHTWRGSSSSLLRVRHNKCKG